jgi:hypothetical protein
MDTQRKRANSASKYSLYSELLRRKIEQYGVEPRHMYNIDEKGFVARILLKMKRVFSQRLYEQGATKQLIQDGTHE